MDNERDILHSVQSALSHGARPDFDGVLERLENEKLKGKVINMNETANKKKRIIPIAIAAALLIAAIGGFVGYSLGHGSDLPAPGVETGAPVESITGSVITLDVNPSIEIDVDRNDTVTAVKALNSDARVVIGSMDFTGSSLEVTVNALIGSMLTNGYLDDLRNSILVSVTDGDTSRASALQQSVTGMIESALGTGGLDGAVISQTVTPDAALTDLAVSYNITEGKAQLINSLVAADPTLTVENLAGLSVNDIALIASSRGLSASSVTTTGTASSGAYISADEALAAACSHAGVNSADITAKKTEFDSERGRLVYEIEFYTSEAEYDYDIDALTGEVVKAEREAFPTGITVPSQTSAPNSSYIGEAAAKQAALDHSGVDSASVVWTKAQFERDDGRYVYELEFACSGAEYDYKIDALSGAVLEFERDRYDGWQGNGNGAQTGSYIGDAAAKSAALAAAGVSEADTSRMKVELDRDDGYTFYEVEFRVGRMEYEYTIDAFSGSVLWFETDYDD